MFYKVKQSPLILHTFLALPMSLRQMLNLLLACTLTYMKVCTCAGHFLYKFLTLLIKVEITSSARIEDCDWIELLITPMGKPFHLLIVCNLLLDGNDCV